MSRSVIDAIRSGRARVVQPKREKRGRVTEAVLDAVRRLEAATEDEIVGHVQKVVPGSKVPGIKAVITKLVNKRKLVAVEHKGDIYYLLKSTYERLREGR